MTDVLSQGEIDQLLSAITSGEAVASKLSARYLYSAVRRAGQSENLPVIRRSLDSAEVTLVAELGSSPVRVRDVLSLRPGDVVRLDRVRADEPLTATIENRRIFLCRPGTAGRRLSVQVVKVCGKPRTEETLSKNVSAQ